MLAEMKHTFAFAPYAPVVERVALSSEAEVVPHVNTFDNGKMDHAGLASFFELVIGYLASVLLCIYCTVSLLLTFGFLLGRYIM